MGSPSFVTRRALAQVPEHLPLSWAAPQRYPREVFDGTARTQGTARTPGTGCGRVGQAADLTDVAAHFVGIAHPDAHQFEERVLHDFRDHHLADKTGSPHHNSLGYPLFFTWSPVSPLIPVSPFMVLPHQLREAPNLVAQLVDVSGRGRLGGVFFFADALDDP